MYINIYIFYVPSISIIVIMNNDCIRHLKRIHLFILFCSVVVEDPKC